MNELLKNSLFVAAGGALGAVMRHLLNLASFSANFPIGTVVENISGALLLGVVAGFVATVADAPAWLRNGVGVGFCGGYTTMSTFAADSFLLAAHQPPSLTALYVGLSLSLGLGAAVLGLSLGRRYGSQSSPGGQP